MYKDIYRTVNISWQKYWKQILKKTDKSFQKHKDLRSLNFISQKYEKKKKKEAGKRKAVRAWNYLFVSEE